MSLLNTPRRSFLYTQSISTNFPDRHMSYIDCGATSWSGSVGVDLEVSVQVLHGEY
jgi:hypothetical protein